jgi:hypothetical protein
VTATDGADAALGRLLERVLVNPGAVAERVFQPVVEQLWRDGADASDDDEAPELVIATALGNRLARAVSGGDPAAPDDWRAVPGRAVAPYEQLVERNAVLALALGACDCWGQQPDCPICDGAGEPGWVPPDRTMFASYVYPAVRAIKGLGASPVAGRRARKPTEEIGHVEHVAR